jgi:hypothetical protein
METTISSHISSCSLPGLVPFPDLFPSRTCSLPGLVPGSVHDFTKDLSQKSRNAPGAGREAFFVWITIGIRRKKIFGIAENRILHKKI